MNYLEKLLEGVEVEWKTLSEVATIGTGSRNTNESIVGGKYPFFVRSQKPRTINDYEFDETAIITAGDGVGVGKVFHYVTGKYSLHQRAYRIVVSDNCIISKYLFHFIRNNFAKYLEMTSVHASVTSLRKPMFDKYPIPIPPVTVQKEIVRILDAFTELTAELTTELTAELTARKQQYSYYREQLLSFEAEEVQWKTLGEVALDFGRGKSKHRPRNDEKLYGGDVPFIQTGDIRNASHFINQYSQTYSEFGLKQSKLWPKGTLCITIAANIAETSILGFDACFPDSIIGFVANPEKTSSSYVEYLLSSIKTTLVGMGEGSAQSNINLGTFKNLKLPFPPIEEQERIVAILDKFDTLTTSLSEGLPKEIELRKKQYEYYRDMLLTFPQLESV